LLLVGFSDRVWSFYRGWSDPLCLLPNEVCATMLSLEVMTLPWFQTSASQVAKITAVHYRAQPLCCCASLLRFGAGNQALTNMAYYYSYFLNRAQYMSIDPHSTFDCC
jgi:hypothetical protein